MIVRIKMTEGNEDLFPKKAHGDDAAFDLYASEGMVIPPRETAAVPTGVTMELPLSCEAQVRSRSGMAVKHSVFVLNSPGTIDAGYRGEVKAILHNAGTDEYVIGRGDRIAQMVIQQLPEVSLEKAEELSGTERGEGGFGSTGV